MEKRRALSVFITLVILITIFSALLVITNKSSWLYDEDHIVKRLKIVSVSMQVDVDPGVNRQKMVAMVQTIREEHL
jgi:hypothetical protein